MSAGVHTRVRSGRVIQRCQNENPRETMWPGMWMMPCTGGVRRGFWEIWEKSESWVLPRKKTVDFRLLAETWRQVSHVVWGRWESQVYLSPYVEKPFKSNVIKCFVPELRIRKCFSCFGIPMICVFICALWTLWTFCVPVWVCLFHVFISGYVTIFLSTTFWVLP